MKHNFTRPYIAIDFTHYWQYVTSNLIPFLDFSLFRKKGLDPAKYIFQYSLILMWIAILTDLIDNKRVSTIVWLSIISQVYYVLVIGVYYAGVSDFQAPIRFTSIKYYKKKASEPFDIDQDGNVSYHLHIGVRYALLFVACIFSGVRTYTFAFYAFDNSTAQWIALFSLGLSYTEFIFQFLKGVFMLGIRNGLFTHFTFQKFAANDVKQIDEYIATKWYINTYRPLEWFSLNVNTIGGLLVIIAELFYIIFLFIFKKSDEVAWYIILADAGITVFLYIIIFVIRYQYRYHSNIVKERLQMYDQQLNSIPLPVEPEIQSMINFLADIRWTVFVEQIGCLESLGLFIAEQVLYYIITQLIYVLFFVTIFQKISAEATISVNV